MSYKYLRCPECGITLEASDAGGPGTREAGTFEHQGARRWRCANCGYEGELILLREVGKIRPAELVLRSLVDWMNTRKPKKRTKESQAWTLLNRIKNMGVSLRDTKKDVEELSKAGNSVLTKLNKRIMEAL